MNFIRILLGWGGRIDRMTYFLAVTAATLIGLLLGALGGALGKTSPGTAALAALVSVVFGLWSGFAANVKRLRDLGRSPFWCLLPLGLLFVAAMIAGPSFVAALMRKDGAGMLMALLGGGLMLVGANSSHSVMTPPTIAAPTSASAHGEPLSLFGGGGHEPEPSGPGRLDQALAAALAGGSPLSRASVAPVPARAAMTTGRSPGGPLRGAPVGGGRPGFGRRV